MPAKPPNILFIICDDLTYGDLSAHGNPLTRTPHLDRLRAQSCRWERHCSGPVCTPARASVMTGRYPYRTKAIDTYCGRSTLDPDEITLADVLGAAGYRTCLSGKWHLGDTHASRPVDMGFEEGLWHNAGGLRQPGCPGHWDDPPQDDYFDPLLNHNGQWTDSQGYCTDIFTDHAMQFIDAHRDERWFCYLAFNAPHTPCIAPDGTWERFVEAGCSEPLAKLYGMVENIDENVGRILAHLDALDITDETIVIFTSDHGAQGGGEHGIGTASSKFRFNSGLRGGKGTPYDGGIRTPVFFRWPGVVEPGEIRCVSNPIDFLPTLTAAAGATSPADRTIDGVDLMPRMRGDVRPGDWPGRSCFIQWHRGDVPVRDRNVAVVEDRWKLVIPWEDQPTELYDTQADPAEQHDLASSHPAEVERLKKAYVAWFDDVCSERPDNFAPVPAIVGTPEEPVTLLNRNDWRVEQRDAWIEDDLPAHWVIEVTATGAYRIKAELPPAVRAGEVRLEVDGRAVAVEPLAAGERSVRFDGVKLRAGRHTVKCRYFRGRQWTQARYVRMARLD